MSDESRAFRDALSTLPMPLAQALRRAANAKSPEAAHLNAYFFFECSLKFAAVAQLGAYASLGFPDAKLNASLEGLAKPMVGLWFRWLCDLSEFLETRREPGVQPICGTRERLMESAPRPGAAAFLRFAARLKEKEERHTDFSIYQVIEALVAYRNEEVGHGVLRTAAICREGAPLLLNAAIEINRALRPAGELRLAISEEDEGGALAWKELTGDGLRVAVAGPEPFGPRGRLALVGGTACIPLHPFVVHESDPLERDRFGFLNHFKEGRRGGPKPGAARVEYLDYDSGERVKSLDACAELAEVFGRLRGRTTAPGEVADLSRAGDAPVPDHGATEVGRWIGDFKLLGELGRGGMATVYKARQAGLERIVALKVLPLAMGQDEVAVKRFSREIASLARCDHPNVVKVLTAGVEEDGGLHWYAMEYVEGCDLARLFGVLKGWREPSGGRLTEGHLQVALSAITRSGDKTGTQADGKPAMERLEPEPVPFPKATEGRTYYLRLAEIMADAARGVQHLHDRGILHRDLKPANLVLTSDGRRAVVMDLGLARVSDQSHSLTATNVKILGTLRYMPPEQLRRNLEDLTPAADVYSLGASLYELAVLRPIHDGKTEEVLIQQVLNEDPVLPRVANPSVPRELEAIVLKAIEKDARRRYATAGELADDLKRWIDGDPIRARSPGPAQFAWKWVVRRRVTVGIGGVALLALGVTLGVLVPKLSAERRARVRSEKTSSLWAGVSGLFSDAEMNRRLGQVDRSRALVEKGIGECEASIRESDFPEARYLKARFLHLKGDLAGTRSELDRAIAMDPKFGEAHFERAIVLLELYGDIVSTEQEAAVTKLLGEKGTELPTGTELEAKIKDLRDLRDQAMADFAVEVGQSSWFRPADRLYAKAEMNRLLGRLDEAAKALEEVLAADPLYVRALLSLALISRHRRDWDATIAFATQAIDRDKGLGDAYALRAGMYTEQANETPASRKADQDRLRQLALDDAIRGLELGRPTARAYAGRGWVRWQKRDMEGALADLSEAIRLNPRYSMAWNNRGAVYSQCGKPDKAADDYEKSIKLNPLNAWAWYNLGCTRRELGQGEEAVRAETEVMKIQPTWIEPYVERAWAYVLLKRYDEALADFEQILVRTQSREGIHSAEAFRGKSQISEARGHHEEAVRFMETAIKSLAPAAPELAEYQSELSRLKEPR